MDFKRIIVAAIAMMAMGHVQAVLIEFGGTVTDIDDSNGLLVQTFGDHFAAADEDLVTGLVSLSGQIIFVIPSYVNGALYYIDPRAGQDSFNLTINQQDLVFVPSYILIGNDRPCHTGSTPCDTADYWIVGANLRGVLIQLVFIIRDGEWLDDEQFFMIDSYPSNYEEVFVRAYHYSVPTNPPILLTATVDSKFVSLPVPSTVALFGIGLVSLALTRRRAFAK
jgi:hypothetical protein